MASSEPLSSLFSDSLLWHDAGSAPWLITVTWGSVNGRVEAVGVEMRSARGSDSDALEAELAKWLPPASRFDDNPTGRQPVPITATTWRRVPVGRLVDDLRKRAAKDREALEPIVGAGALTAWRRPRRPAAPATLEDVAAVYREVWQRGDRKPTVAVARRFSISHSTAAKRVQRAREAGLLPQTSRGRAAGSVMNEGAAP